VSVNRAAFGMAAVLTEQVEGKTTVIRKLRQKRNGPGPCCRTGPGRGGLRVSRLDQGMTAVTSYSHMAVPEVLSRKVNPVVVPIFTNASLELIGRLQSS